MNRIFPKLVGGLVLAIFPMAVMAQRAPHSPVQVPPSPAGLPPGQKAPQVTDIWVVFKTHCDLGYTASVDAVNEKYRVAMMDNAVRLMEADRALPPEQRFKWTIAGWPMAENILGPKQDPARKTKVEEGLREGAFAVHALPATLHTESFDPEDLVRSLGFSSKVARTYGITLPISAKMTDVPGHAWILPTLLHHAGIRFIQLGANYSVRPMLVPHLFWWEGPDGSRVLCNYTPKKFEASFEDHRAFARNAESIATRNIAERLSLLAHNVRQDGGRIVVFNPLPWKRSGFIEVDGRRRFAKDVPSCGYITLSDKSDKSDNPDNTDLETPFFKATFDLKRGGISSLVGKSTGRELLDITSPHALGQFLLERFSEAQTWDYYDHYNTMNNAAWGTVKPNMPEDAVYQTVTPTDWQASMSHSEGRDEVTLTAGNTHGLAKTITIKFTFPAHEPSVETEWSIDGKNPTTIPEGGWLCFPFSVKDPRFLLGRTGGITDFAKDLIPGGNRHLLGIQSGVAVTSPEGGVSLCALDAPCISLGEPGLWKYTFNHIPPNASLFVNLYNNMWNTNFPTWIEGSWSSRVRIWPVAATTDPKPDLITRSWEARCPLLAAGASGKGGDIPPSQSGLTLSRKGVLVTAFGGNPDGEHTLLRVWEQAGGSGDLTVSMPAGAGFTRATPVNLRGEVAGPPVSISNGVFRFPLPAYAPASFILSEPLPCAP